jgi:superfamily II DNA/RNA helicase
VDVVINFAMARSGDDYVHRIGRTGRAGAKGLAVSLVAPQEWNLMQSIERYLGITLEPRTVPGLESRFKGPAGKKPPAAARKKEQAAKTQDKQKEGKKKRAVPKAQQRHSYTKNIGKRRQPSAARQEQEAPAPLDKMEQQGRAPLKRKPKGETE